MKIEKEARYKPSFLVFHVSFFFGGLEDFHVSFDFQSPVFFLADPTAVRGMIPSKSQISSFFFITRKAVPSDIQPQVSTGE